MPKVTSASSTSIQGGFPSITQPLLKLRVLPRSRAVFEDPPQEAKDPIQYDPSLYEIRDKAPKEAGKPDSTHLKR